MGAMSILQTTGGGIDDGVNGRMQACRGVP